MNTSEFTLQNAPYLIHKERGTLVVNTQGFAHTRDMRPATRDEVLARGLPLPEEITTTVKSHVELPGNLDEMPVAQLNKFVVDHGLATSLNTTIPQPELVHHVRVLVAKHNKEVTNATTYIPELPEGFYAYTIPQLKTFCQQNALEYLDFKGLKKDQMQKLIIGELSAKRQEEDTIAADERETVIAEAQAAAG